MNRMLNTQQWADEVRKLVQEGKQLDEAMAEVKIMIEQQQSQLNRLIFEIHDNAVVHGFWEDYFRVNASLTINAAKNYKELMQQDIMLLNNAIGNRLMLITGEVAEAHEALRKNDINNFREEIADVIIRCLDLCGGLEIDIQTEIYKKMEKNKSRPYKHGKAF